MNTRRLFLYGIAFMSGAVNLAFEMILGRLMAPYFGVTNLVWACIISIVLLYISLGSVAGGKIVDRTGDSPFVHSGIILSAAVLSSMVMPGYYCLRIIFSGPYVGPIVFFSSFLGALVFFSLPVLFLAMLLPVVTWLLTRDDSHGGEVIGRVYAVNTMGAITGAIGAVICIIPLAGLFNGIYGITMVLLVCGTLYGMGAPGVTVRRRVILFLVAGIVCAVCMVSAILLRGTPGDGSVLYEAESPYNYIRVSEAGDALLVTVNDPHFVQSLKYRTDEIRDDVWSAYLMAPLLRGLTGAGKVLFLGYGCGTAACMYGRHFPDFSLTGVEIDPGMIETGERFVSGDCRPVNVLRGDGRSMLYRINARFDVIISDMFRFPYIPHHLITVEYFRLVKKKLKDGGVIAVNTGRYGGSDEMTRRIARTLKACFTHVMSLKVGYYNTVLFCSDSPLDCRNLQGLPSALGDVADTFRDRLNPERTVAQKGSGGILVDDRAESEFITHAMGIRYIMKEYFRCM